MENKLHVVEEISENGLNETIEKYSLRTNSYEQFIQLNYDQINSPKNEITNECRGLILDITNPVPIVVAYPFRRFFNYGEGYADNINFNSDYVKWLTKLDGSTILTWYNIYEERIMFSTRGSIDAAGNVGHNDFTFKDLANRAISENNYDFKPFYQKTNINLVFELTSPYNKIVTYYEKPELTLLAARNIDNLEEFNYSILKLISNQIGCNLPRIFNLHNIDSAIKMLDSVKPTDEGFVAVDYGNKINGSYQRVKVKNPRYLAISKLVNAGGEMTDERFIDIVKLGEVEEVCTYYPEYREKLVDIQEKLSIINNRTKEEYLNIVPAISTKETRKDFALKAKDMLFPAALFQMLDGKIKEPRELLYNMKSDKIVELIRKI